MTQEEQLAADAARWRWFRERWNQIVFETDYKVGIGSFLRRVQINPNFGAADPASLDAAFDAAMNGTDSERGQHVRQLVREENR